LTVAAASSGKRKDAIFKIEVINETLFAQALGNLFGFFVLSFKGVYQAQADEIGHFDLHRHGAAVGGTRVAHARFVARPTFDAVYVDDADGGFQWDSA
jgi:hypothetical protein